MGKTAKAMRVRLPPSFLFLERIGAMLLIILLFIIVVWISYIVRSPKMILYMMLLFMGVAMLMTPFWPFIFIGLVVFQVTNKKKNEEELIRKKYEQEEYKHRDQMYTKKRRDGNQ